MRMYKTSVLDFLEDSCERTPENIAFADPDREISFAELKRKARAIGTFFLKNHIFGKPAAFYMEKSVPAVCALFGAVYAGAFYSFIDVRQPAARAEKVLSNLAPAVLITDAEHREAAGEIFPENNIILIDDLMGLSEIDEVGLTSVRRRMTDTQPLYCNFTSGSTGVPKGVVVSHRSVIEFISHFVPIFGIREDDVIANQAPFDFDVSVKDIYSGLLTGARVQLVPRDYFSNPTVLMDYLCEKKATVLVWAVSAMCFVSIMNGFSYRTPESIRLVLFSGEVMPPKQYNVWKKALPEAVFVNLYGPTEITCNCTYYRLEDRLYEKTESIPIGQPFPNEKVFLLSDEDSLVTAAGVEGEICVSGTCLALGYYRDPERTRAAFMQNPLNKSYDERMYRTGDIGKYDEEGRLVYVSRKDFQVKHLGQRIELGEIEIAAMACSGVDRAACLYDAKKKKILLFYSGSREKGEVDSELKKALPPYMVPGKTVQMDALPLNKNGKIDRHALEESLQK